MRKIEKIGSAVSRDGAPTALYRHQFTMTPEPNRTGHWKTRWRVPRWSHWSPDPTHQEDPGAMMGGGGGREGISVAPSVDGSGNCVPETGSSFQPRAPAKMVIRGGGALICIFGTYLRVN